MTRGSAAAFGRLTSGGGGARRAIFIGGGGVAFLVGGGVVSNQLTSGSGEKNLGFWEKVFF